MNSSLVPGRHTSKQQGRGPKLRLLKPEHCGVFTLLMALATANLLAQGPTATPQRPSLSSNASTVPRGLLEVESGLLLTDTAGAFPLFAKYGFTDSLELNIGGDALRWVDNSGKTTRSGGDLLLGTRWRTPGNNAPVQLAFSTLVKLPTGGTDTGTGQVDGTLTGIASIGLGKGFGLDLNLALSALGKDGPGSLGQGQAIVTLGLPPAGRWSGYLETAYQKTAGQSDGGFVDIGLGFATNPRMVFDIAAGMGWAEGYPDWSFTVGWTNLFATPN